MLKSKPPKEKLCKICDTWFQPQSGLSPKVCSIPCAIKKAENDRIEKKKKANRKALKEYKDKNKTYNQLIKDAWTPCSKWVRLVRDINEPCISCGRYDHEIPDTFRGGKWDAGHYLGKAAHPELRFHPDNIHKQCKSCNGGAGQYAKKNHTVTQAYRINLIEKVGIDMVDWLEGPHEAQNWTHEDLRDIPQYYKAKLKALAMQTKTGQPYYRASFIYSLILISPVAVL